MNEPTLYRRVRPEDVARLAEEQRERCEQCGAGCTQPLPFCAGRTTWADIKAVFWKMAPTISVMAMCGGIALFAGLCFQAAPK